MLGRRIFVDASKICSGLRKQSCVLIHPERHKTVSDVIEHISRSLGVPNNFVLLNDGWFVPATEDSYVLHENDTISLAIDDTVENSQDADSRGKENQMSESERMVLPFRGERNEASSGNGGFKSPLNLRIEVANSVKKVSLDTEPLTAKQSPPSVNEAQISAFLKEMGSCVSFQNENQNSINVPLLNHELRSAEGSHTSQKQVSSEESLQSPTPHKKIRRRKRKREVKDEIAPKHASHSPYMMNKVLQGVGHILNTTLPVRNSKHIFFKTEPDEIPSQVNEHDNSVVSPEKSNGVLSKLMSLSKDGSAPVVFERRRSQNSNENQKPQREIKLKDLKSLPMNGTTIKFKVLKMINYSPSISEEITAIVVSSDKVHGQINVEVTEKLEEFQSDKGKFSLEVEEEEEDIPDKFRSLNWNELIEPKMVEIDS